MQSPGSRRGVAPCWLDAPEFFAANATEDLPKVVFSNKRTDSSDIFLYHKTTRRDLYDQERQKAVAEGFFEVLFCNEKGEITEGAITSLFIRQGDAFYTPPVACGLLPGVFRRHFLARSDATVHEKILYPADLTWAEEIYVANSVRGMVQVKPA